MMTQSLTGKTLSEANTIFGEFHRMVLGELEPSSTPNQLGKLKIFQGVRDFPSRVKCASLPWHAMTGAMSDDGGEISTE